MHEEKEDQGERLDGVKNVSGAPGDAPSPSPLVGEGARRAGEGGAGLQRIRRVRGLARDMRHTPTEAERLMWGLLRDRRFAGFKFRRQVPLGSYIADFVCYAAHLVVELDGGQHSENPADQRRDAEFGRMGFRVLRIWNNDLMQQRDAVLEAVWQALQNAGPNGRSSYE